MRLHVKKTHLEILFIYLGNKKIYCIFNTRCIISVLFSTQHKLFHNFIFFCPNNTFITKNRPKCKYKVVQIWPELFVRKQVTVCPGHIWTTLYQHGCLKVIKHFT
jgi:hypothetical protein